MKIVIDFTKSAQDNANDYFSKSKKLKHKSEGAAAMVVELKKQLENIESKPLQSKKLKRMEKREWYERFNWFFTSDGLLVIGGRSAVQNDEINSKYFEDTDLFFHADIFGASVMILKNGVSSSKETREEVAQFAGSFSSAWENLQSSVDVYSLTREQVTKSRNSGSLSTGSFLLKGEREWYKGVPLKLCAFVENEKIRITPELTCQKLGVKHYVSIMVGKSKKSDASKFISNKLGYENIDYIMQHLPSGTFSVKEV
ncbi:MAG: NFACT RNA binding domain-containing protein [Candidatus Marsarchaeota archaeon]|nr:NFACT RNA binding domain-containing protein [Candidatus Marsarchaeota archaeon]